MNILFFIDDLNSSSGVNYDINIAKKNIEKYTSHKVFIVSHNDQYDEFNTDTLMLGNINIAKKYLNFKRFVDSKNINIAHVRGVGLGSVNHLLSFLLCYLLKVKLTVTTFSQINYFALNNKIFFENPDIKLMKNEGNSKGFKLSFFNFLSSKFTPIFKKVYFLLISKYFLKRVSSLIFFSQYEMNQVSRLLNLDNTKYQVYTRLFINLM